MNAQAMSNVAVDLGKMVYFEEESNTLFVSKHHAFHANVRSYIHKLREKGHHAQIEHVDMDLIDSKRNLMKESTSFNAEASSMQLAAKTIFAKAVHRRASDIHIRVSFKGSTRIFFRIHNDLHLIEEQVASFGKLLCSAIYMAMCDISDSTYEELERQDARISSRDKLPEGLDGIRVATTPQVDGCVMVLRLLYNDANKSNDLCALGYTEAQRDLVTLMKRKPTGINIIGGPTGSGKSTTLQRTLLSIYEETRGTKHIITVEDPPEYPMPGIVQTPVANASTEEERSAAFQASIKATMRLDPNVIMIGEMRDPPSAGLAIQAAMTGHQVWSTVHANSAFAIIDRMVDIGISINLMTDPTIVTGLVCQRLLKVLCNACKAPLSKVLSRYSQEDQNKVVASVETDRSFVMGDGCSKCQNTGIAGRTVVSEVIVPDQQMMAYVRLGEKQKAIDYWHSIGGSNMLQQAIIKINAGLVDPFQAEEEVGLLNLKSIEIPSGLVA
jgi:general secretion pathway protein E